jgi:hypothetical protein
MTDTKPLRTVPFHYLSAAPVTPPPSSRSSKKPASSRRSKPHDPQTTRDDLAKLGIKVKDFAYESLLPPVKPWRPLQIQPSLKRPGDDDEAHERRKRLRRESTEPVLEEEEMRAAMLASNRHQTRRRGFADLNREGNPSETEVPKLFSQLSDASFDASQPPALTMSQSQSQSQQTEPLVVTPIVTPNGSYDWSARAPSKGTPYTDMEKNNAESQFVPPIVLSYEDLGLHPPTEVAAPQADELPTARVEYKRAPSSSLQSQQTAVRFPTVADASPTPGRVFARPTPRRSLECGISVSSLPTPPRSRYRLRSRLGAPAQPRAAPIPATNKRKRSTSTLKANASKPSSTVPPTAYPRGKGRAKSTQESRLEAVEPIATKLSLAKKTSTPALAKSKSTAPPPPPPPAARRSTRSRGANPAS